LQNPEIAGTEYQHGTLAGYELKEYLLLKWGHQCAYCKQTGVPLQIEHIVPKARGGSDRIINLTLACGYCNQKKGNRTAQEFGFPLLQAQAQQPHKDAAVVNSTRRILYERLKSTGLPIETGTGGRTKHAFQTGDIVRAVVPGHLKNKGVHVGRMASRASGAFTIVTRKETVKDVGYRYCTLLQRNDGYGYLIARKEDCGFLPVPERGPMLAATEGSQWV
jgi:hypothetical protein